jgi:hypothetical protein
MSTNPRRERHLKKKIAKYILLLGIGCAVVFFLNVYSIFRSPLYVSPIGRADNDKTLVEKLLKDNKILFSAVAQQGNYYLVSIQNNGQVKLAQNKDLASQIASLQRILRELTIEGKPFKGIDFRFSEPIISF